MSRQTAANKTISALWDHGWRISHDALVNRYRLAGSVSPMQTRNDREYCRVHHGKRVGKHSWQVTTVMYRPIQSA